MNGFWRCPTSYVNRDAEHPHRWWVRWVQPWAGHERGLFPTKEAFVSLFHRAPFIYDINTIEDADGHGSHSFEDPPPFLLLSINIWGCRKLVDMEIMSYRSPCIPRHCRLFCCYSIPAFFFSYRNTTTVGCHPNQRRLYR